MVAIFPTRDREGYVESSPQGSVIEVCEKRCNGSLNSLRSYQGIMQNVTDKNNIDDKP